MPSDADPDVTEPALCWGAAQLKLPAFTLAFTAGGEATGAAVPPEVAPPPDEEEEEEAVVVVPEAELELEVPFDG